MQACHLFYAGQLQFGSAQVTVAGRAPVSLSWIPKHDNRSGYVYAQSSQAVIIREGQGEPAFGHQPGAFFLSRFGSQYAAEHSAL